MAEDSAKIPSVGHLTHEQTTALEICTRTMSVLSLLGSCYIISTFLAFSFYRKPINRLVFYATWGNILANVATLISTSGIPHKGQSLTPLCEFQAVLIQWFMMADSLWVFCMATNVYLVFWRGYDALQLRHLEKWYFLFAYGLPAIAPIVYVILDHHRKVPVLGPATLWCWIDREVDWMRIAFFYAPVWIFVSATLTIYVATGIKIVRKGALLRYFESQQRSGNRDSMLPEENSASPFAAGKNIVVTTQIEHEVQEHDVESRYAPYGDDSTSLSSYSSTQHLSKAHPREEVDVHSPDQIRASRASRDLKVPAHTTLRQYEEEVESGYKATICTTRAPLEASTLPPRPTSAATNRRHSHIKKAAGNEAALAYLKVAFLMFLALIVVWVPSSVNRLYQFIHKDDTRFALSLISAIVLSMQGVWNATIYIYTTRAEFRRAYASLQSRILARFVPYHAPMNTYKKDSLTSSQGTKDYDAEIQMEEGLKQGGHLHSSRPDGPI
ncbi:G protein coupled receptor family protein [Phaeosphaeria sp. MPI-PUGE-AT-0046c]|nr:G protein coupled receptor family protein [Phaeosphaeria sp. MPI-PUGE-AT-0046c]